MDLRSTSDYSCPLLRVIAVCKLLCSIFASSAALSPNRSFTTSVSESGSSFPCEGKPKHHNMSGEPLSMYFTISSAPQSPPATATSWRIRDLDVSQRSTLLAYDYQRKNRTSKHPKNVGRRETKRDGRSGIRPYSPIRSVRL
jgi:hypothetical protein